MMPDPDPLDGTVEQTPERTCAACGRDIHDEIHALSHPNHHPWWNPAYQPPDPSKARWYLLASFVTGLLLGAAVARVVGL